MPAFGNKGGFSAPEPQMPAFGNKGGAGSIGPRWTWDETIEAPAGERDMDGYTIRIYTDE